MPSKKPCSTSLLSSMGPTQIGFVENQLSRSLISLSPLSIPHPKALQRLPVRSSTSSYGPFNLGMDSSPRFGSTHWDLSSYLFVYLSSPGVFPRLSPSLSSFQLSPQPCNSLIHYTISIQSLLLLLLVFLCCLVSCFPSQYSPLSITSPSLCFVGGSTLFRPHVLYFRTLCFSLSFRSPLLLSSLLILLLKVLRCFNSLLLAYFPVCSPFLVPRTPFRTAVLFPR